MPASSSSLHEASDCVVVGGGVIGLSIAYQLARDGLSVTLLERNKPGREASWAGAGILPPGSWYGDHPALESLAALSHQRHPEWAAALLEETDIDNEYWQCGSLYVETPENRAYLQAVFKRWRAAGIAVESAEWSPTSQTAWSVSSESQIRNPRHLKALEAACFARGVRIVSQAPATRLLHSEGRLEAIETPQESFSGEVYCLAAGCWTPGLIRESGVTPIEGRPIRGQMLLLRLKQGASDQHLKQILHLYPYYLVPRKEGRVLVGATVEDVGFDHQTTDAARRELMQVACDLVPSLAEAEIEGFWSGLRPQGTELPQIGWLPGIDNTLIATGHFRAGLQFSPATAEIVSSLIRRVEPPLDADPFALGQSTARACLGSR